MEPNLGILPQPIPLVGVFFTLYLPVYWLSKLGKPRAGLAKYIRLSHLLALMNLDNKKPAEAGFLFRCLRKQGLHHAAHATHTAHITATHCWSIFFR